MDPEAGGLYRCMSRVADGEFIFDVRSGRCAVAGKFVELITKSVQYFIETKLPFIALHDGEALLYDTITKQNKPLQRTARNAKVESTSLARGL